MFDHFVGLALKGLTTVTDINIDKEDSITARNTQEVFSGSAERKVLCQDFSGTRIVNLNNTHKREKYS